MKFILTIHSLDEGGYLVAGEANGDLFSFTCRTLGEAYREAENQLDSATTKEE